MRTRITSARELVSLGVRPLNGFSVQGMEVSSTFTFSPSRREPSRKTVHRRSSRSRMEPRRLAFLRQRKAGRLLLLRSGLPHLSSDLIRAWRLPIASKPVPVRNTCLRKISRCAPTICLFMELSSLEQLTSICCLRLSSPLRTPLAWVFQTQRHSRLDEKFFHPVV